ncbi:alpha/beta hydrolase [[Mycobacterium] vasticus]|uniref:Alpha/beta hydrolase n=1 Tax=[Mycobacterium] vasticus TaxID=2875777 RepID=A0ABU5Z0P6_9MYCO|nr:alpha/beta hydrolase [Mycolicibacter sp. MYC017]MEB3070651.1 alpha/beta hydrolase [Mycolicibacter sp. MYC017]
MAPRLVLIHGGMHTGGCWDDTVEAVAELRPDIQVDVVDLPGRRSCPADLASLTIADCVDAVSQQIVEHAAGDGDRPIVLVGHSLAGVVLPGVVNSLGVDKIAQVIFVACCVPPPGQCVVDTLPRVLKPIVRYLAGRSGIIDRVPPGLTRYSFGNAATAEQRGRIHANMVPESSALITEIPADRLPDGVRTSWVLTQRDRALPAAKQRGFIANIGGVDDLRYVDAAHEVMITHPVELAAILIELATAAGQADRIR